MTDNRTNEQIVADALRKVSTLGWNSGSIGVIEAVNALSNAGRLVAAQGAAPVPSSGVDEDALAEVIGRRLNG